MLDATLYMKAFEEGDPNMPDFLGSAKMAQQVLAGMAEKLDGYIRVEGAHREAVSRLQRVILDLQSQLSANAVEKKAAELDTDTERATVVTLRKRIESLEEDTNTSFPNKLRELNEDITRLEAQVAETQTDARAWKQRAGTFKKSKAETLERAAATFEEMKADIITLSDKVADLQEELTGKEDNAPIASNEVVKGFESQLAVLASERDLWKERATDAKKAYNELRKSIPGEPAQ
jgi:chromosome segregation ATPase